MGQTASSSGDGAGEGGFLSLLSKVGTDKGQEIILLNLLIEKHDPDETGFFQVAENGRFCLLVQQDSLVYLYVEEGEFHALAEEHPGLTAEEAIQYLSPRPTLALSNIEKVVFLASSSESNGRPLVLLSQFNSEMYDVEFNEYWHRSNIWQQKKQGLSQTPEQGRSTLTLERIQEHERQQQRYNQRQEQARIAQTLNLSIENRQQQQKADQLLEENRRKRDEKRMQQEMEKSENVEFRTRPVIDLFIWNPWNQVVGKLPNIDGALIFYTSPISPRFVCLIEDDTEAVIYDCDHLENNQPPVELWKVECPSPIVTFCFSDIMPDVYCCMHELKAPYSVAFPPKGMGNDDKPPLLTTLQIDVEFRIFSGKTLEVARQHTLASYFFKNRDATLGVYRNEFFFVDGRRLDFFRPGQIIGIECTGEDQIRTNVIKISSRSYSKQKDDYAPGKKTWLFCPQGFLSGRYLLCLSIVYENQKFWFAEESSVLDLATRTWSICPLFLPKLCHAVIAHSDSMHTDAMDDDGRLLAKGCLVTSCGIRPTAFLQPLSSCLAVSDLNATTATRGLEELYPVMARKTRFCFSIFCISDKTGEHEGEKGGPNTNETRMILEAAPRHACFFTNFSILYTLLFLETRDKTTRKYSALELLDSWQRKFEIFMPRSVSGVYLFISKPAFEEMWFLRLHTTSRVERPQIFYQHANEKFDELFTKISGQYLWQLLQYQHKTTIKEKVNPKTSIVKPLKELVQFFQALHVAECSLYLSGHGFMPPSPHVTMHEVESRQNTDDKRKEHVAGLTIKKMNKLLSDLSALRIVKLVFLSTCASGGLVFQTLLSPDRPLDFVFIVNNTSDSSVYSTKEKEISDWQRASVALCAGDLKFLNSMFGSNSGSSFGVHANMHLFVRLPREMQLHIYDPTEARGEKSIIEVTELSQTQILLAASAAAETARRTKTPLQWPVLSVSPRQTIFLSASMTVSRIEIQGLDLTGDQYQFSTRILSTFPGASWHIIERIDVLDLVLGGEFQEILLSAPWKIPLLILRKLFFWMKNLYSARKFFLLREFALHKFRGLTLLLKNVFLCQDGEKEEEKNVFRCQDYELSSSTRDDDDMTEERQMFDKVFRGATKVYSVYDTILDASSPHYQLETVYDPAFVSTRAIVEATRQMTLWMLRYYRRSLWRQMDKGSETDRRVISAVVNDNELWEAFVSEIYSSVSNLLTYDADERPTIPFVRFVLERHPAIETNRTLRSVFMPLKRTSRPALFASSAPFVPSLMQLKRGRSRQEGIQ